MLSSTSIIGMTNRFPKSFATDGVIILLLALLLRVPFFIISSSQPMQRQQAEDSHGYMDLAMNLNKGLGFGRYFQTNSAQPEVWVPELYRTPGYPAFLAAVTRNPNENAAPAVVLQVLLELALCLTVFSVSYLTFGRVPGLVAGVLAAVDLQAISLANLLLSELSFTIVLVAAVFTASQLLKKRGMIWGLVTGLLIAVSVFIRPTTLYLPVFVAGFLAFCALRRRQWVHLATAVIVLAAAYGPIAGWMARNKAKCGAFALTSVTQSGPLGPAAAIRARESGVSLSRAINEICERASVDFWRVHFVVISKEEQKRIADVCIPIIRAHPSVLLKEYVVRTANLLVGPEKYMLQVLGLPPISFGFVEKHSGEQPGRSGLGMALLGVEVLFTLLVYAGVCRTLWQVWKGRHLPGWIWAGFWFAAYVIAISAAICVGDPRYRWPGIPLLILVAAASFTRPRTESAVAAESGEEKISAAKVA